MFTPPAQLNVFDFLFNRGGMFTPLNLKDIQLGPLTIPLGFTPWNSCPACLIARNDRTGEDSLNLLNRGDAIPLGVQLFFKKAIPKAPSTHKEGGAFCFWL